LRKAHNVNYRFKYLKKNCYRCTAAPHIATQNSLGAPPHYCFNQVELFMLTVLKHKNNPSINQRCGTVTTFTVPVPAFEKLPYGSGSDF
jgi:hypothetical protein